MKFDRYGAIIDVEGKTGLRSLRVVASAPAISNWLQEHPDRNNKDAPLFCGIWTHRGKKIHYRYWNDLLKKIGEKAGFITYDPETKKRITIKPMNPHHFRHSRASELAKRLTESQLCYYMGWVQGSKQARTYVHLSGRDTEKTILAMYGLKEEEKSDDEFKPVICPRCGAKNDPAAKFCSQCSLGLDIKAVMEYERDSKRVLKTIDNTETLMSMAETIKALKEKIEKLEHERYKTTL